MILFDQTGAFPSRMTIKEKKRRSTSKKLSGKQLSEWATRLNALVLVFLSLFASFLRFFHFFSRSSELRIGVQFESESQP